MSLGVWNILNNLEYITMVISVKDLSKTYRSYKKEEGLSGALKSFFNRQYIDVEAVKNINFEIEKGEIVGFIGPNGAGKTTTMKMLSGIIYPTNGEVKVLDYIPQKRNESFLKKISLVMGQKSQLWEDLPAMEGFIMNKLIYEIGDDHFDKIINELGGVLQIQDIMDIPIRKLSLGQRMKCELLASLIHSPEVLFLDEPTIGLDVVVQKKIRDFLKNYNQEYKTTILLTSHYMEDVKELCDRVIIINKGELIYKGTLKDLRDKYISSKQIEISFNKKVSRKVLEKYGQVSDYNSSGLYAKLDVPIEKHTNIASKMLKNLPVDDLDINEMSLTEIIRKVF